MFKLIGAILKAIASIRLLPSTTDTEKEEVSKLKQAGEILLQGVKLTQEIEELEAIISGGRYKPEEFDQLVQELREKKEEKDKLGREGYGILLDEDPDNIQLLGNDN